MDTKPSMSVTVTHQWRHVAPEDRETLLRAAKAIAQICKWNGISVEVDSDHFGIWKEKDTYE